MSNYITGEQFGDGLKRVVTNLKQKIDDVSQNGGTGGANVTIENIINNNHTSVENANIVACSNHSKESSLLVWYDFDKYDGGKTIKDESGNLNNSLPLVKSPTFETDNTIGRKVAVFNGTTSYIPMGTSLKVPYYTYSIMAYKDNWEVSTLETLISCTQNGGYSTTIAVPSGGSKIKTQAYVSGAYKSVFSPYLSSQLSAGWHTFTTTNDGYEIRLYIDGILIEKVDITGGTDSRSKMTFHSSNSVLLGAEAYTDNTPETTGYCFNGKMAEVRFYQKPLTDSDIFQMHEEMMNHKNPIISVPVEVTGDYVQNVIIDDVTNPLTLNPIEYGRVKIMNLSSSTTSTDLRFEQSGVVEGNLSLENGKIKLTAGKTYAITMKIGFDGTTSCEINASLISDSSGVLTGVLHKAQDVVSKYSTNLNNSCLYTPQVDDTIYCVNTWSSMSGQNYMLEVNVQEVRNNPVNQYGGFETDVLFEGKMVNLGEYTLEHSLEDYNYAIVEFFKQDNLNSLLPVMTSNTTPAPYSVTVSGQYDNSYAGYKMLDGNLSTFWSSNTSKGYAIIDFGVETDIDSFSITARNGSLDGTPCDFTLYGSNDNVSFEEIKSYTDETNWTASEKRTFYVGTQKYRYYKLDVTKNNGRVRLDIALLEFYMTPKEYYVNDTIIIDSNSYGVYNEKCKIVISKDKVNVLEKSSVSKIIGIKGQIPSLLVGGEF